MAIDLTLLDKYSTLTDISKYSTLNLINYNKLILVRGLEIKFYDQLLELKKNYPIWIVEQQEKLKQTTDIEEIANINNKLKRLVDKYTCTLKEIDIRDRNLIERVV